jgi:hypothetical protein
MPKRDIRLRLIFVTDNFDHFIDIQKRHQQTFEDMQALRTFSRR